MTPGVVALERGGVAHTVLAYEHDPAAGSYGDEAAAALGLDPSSVFKTLVAEVDDGALAVATVAVVDRLDLKALARAASAKRARLADPSRVERVTGYALGGVSPFGQKRALPTFVDRSMLFHDPVHVSAGRRGLEIAVSPHDLISVTAATVADLATRGG